MYHLTILTHFAAAHNLLNYCGDCENLHGHNWKVEACVTGDKLSPAGVLVDFGDLKKYVRSIMGDLDHKYLNELDYFAYGNPSSENIAIYIANKLQGMIQGSGAAVSRITVWESENASATYIMPVTNG